MHQVEETLLSPTINPNGTLLKSESIEQPPPTLTPISVTESAVAPPPVTSTQLITVPIAPAPPLLASTPTLTTKKFKRGFRSYLNTRKPSRFSTKPVTLLARPSIINTPMILSQSQTPMLLTNQIAPIISNPIPTVQTNSAPGFTTYLVYDGNQGQLVQVANDGPKPVIFRNQAGQVLQATPITVVSPTKQPVVSSFPVNGDCSLLSNSSQTITTVRTSSSIDMQQQTTLTSDTTTLTTQQLTGIIHQTPNSILPSTTIINGNNSSLDDSGTSNNNLSLSISQIAQKVNHRHRRSSSSSTSRKKRGRPRLYERDPFTNKPIKSDLTPTQSPTPTSTLLMPGQTTSFKTVPIHSNGCNSLVFSNQNAQIPHSTPSLLQQHSYSYPSLLNGTVSTNILTPPAFNTFSNNPNTTLSTTTFPYSSPSIIKEYSPPSFSSITPTSNVQIPSTTSTNVAQLHTAHNNDVTVHYIGGYVIRESNQPFLSNENLNQKETNEQLRCTLCQKIDLSQRFFDQSRKFCSELCSIQFNEKKTPISNEPIRTFEKTTPQQPIDEPIVLLPDHGLPSDPSKWTVLQVGDFVARLTNDAIREAFYESEMDGQALLLITPEHLRDTMKIKLGPSLVISNEITKLRERAKISSSP